MPADSRDCLDRPSVSPADDARYEVLEELRAGPLQVLLPSYTFRCSGTITSFSVVVVRRATSREEEEEEEEEEEGDARNYISLQVWRKEELKVDSLFTAVWTSEPGAVAVTWPSGASGAKNVIISVNATDVLPGDSLGVYLSGGWKELSLGYLNTTRINTSGGTGSLFSAFVIPAAGSGLPACNLSLCDEEVKVFDAVVPSIHVEFGGQLKIKLKGIYS